MRKKIDPWRVYDNIVIALIAIGLMALLFSSCATKRVIVPEVHERIILQHDTIYHRDSVVSNNTTIIRQADSAMMASYGIRISKMEKAWLVKQNQDTHSNSAVRLIMRKDSIVHDTIPQYVPKNVYIEKKLPWYKNVLIALGGWVAFILIAYLFDILIYRTKK